MAVQQQHVAIQSPCPTTLDPERAAGGVRSWYCGHCEKSVHVLSNMTEAEARSFLAANEGQNICVTYAVRPDGTIRFKAPAPAPVPVVPVASLARKRRMVAAAGIGVALAACAPHENADVVKPSIVAVDAPPVATKPPVVPEQPKPEPIDDRMVDGGLKAVPRPEPLPMPAGGIMAMPIPDEPCDAPKDAPQPMARGGLRAQPVVAR
ncbi:MAG TPA: hypothetical protein VFG69_01885 [Nannocystaceae bacterium]|nr:hypothetical protein [Nannocystaceae bacterium]